LKWGAWAGSQDTLIFWELNTNSSKTVKATDFKFDKHVSRDSPDMTLIQGQGQGHVALKVRNFQKLSHPPFPVGAGKNHFLEDNI